MAGDRRSHSEEFFMEKGLLSRGTLHGEGEGSKGHKAKANKCTNELEGMNAQLEN